MATRMAIAVHALAASRALSTTVLAQMPGMAPVEKKNASVAAATEVAQDIIAKTGQQPFIRAEFLDWGIMVCLRDNTVPAKRQELSTYIIEILLREFGKEFPRVRFAVPSQNIRYRPDVGASGPAGEVITADGSPGAG